MREVRLSELAKLSSGGTPSRTRPDYFRGAIPWVKTLDLTNGLVSATEECITDEALRSIRGTVFPPGTVLVAMYGGEGTIGKAGVLTVEAAINQALCAIPPDLSLFDPLFLLLWLRHVRPAWMKHSAGNRKDPNINKAVVENMRLRLPVISEQHRVRSVLESALESASRASVASQAQLRAAAAVTQAVLRDSFPAAQPIVAVGVANSNLRNSSVTRLTSLARLESGHTPSRRHPEWWGGDVPWLALPDIRKLHGKMVHRTAETTNAAGLANSSARLLPAGTVCVSRTASIGFVTMLGRPMATSQDFCNWICDPERLDPEFLMFAFMASQDHLCELGSGAVHKTIYMPTIESFHLHAPPLDEQRRIARTLREQLAVAEALQVRLAERQAEIERLPQRILAAAFGDV